MFFSISEKYAVVKPLLKTDMDGDDFSSYRLLYENSILSKVPKAACLKQLQDHFSKIPAFQKFNLPIEKNQPVEIDAAKYSLIIKSLKAKVK